MLVIAQVVSAIPPYGVPAIYHSTFRAYGSEMLGSDHILVSCRIVTWTSVIYQQVLPGSIPEVWCISNPRESRCIIRLWPLILSPVIFLHQFLTKWRAWGQINTSSWWWHRDFGGMIGWLNPFTPTAMSIQLLLPISHLCLHSYSISSASLSHRQLDSDVQFNREKRDNWHCERVWREWRLPTKSQP